MRKVFVALSLLLFAGTACAQQAVVLDARLGTPVVVAGLKQPAWLKVGLTGLGTAGPRPPLNVAIVLDKSGSMSGHKLARAKEAALHAVARLRPDDIVSIVAYDTTVRVVVPATKASDQSTLRAGIQGISAGGDTALFAGVSKGAEEVRKFADRQRVNRVILLSDGLANVGPSSPGDLSALGASLGREGISVTTFGLGLDYNEDLMVELARRSDGNHAFIEDASDLARFFDLELGTAVAVVAQDVHLHIRCAEGVRPVRVLGRSADITGSDVRTSLNQVYGRQEQFVLIEVELPAGQPHTSRDVAQVDVSYGNMATRATEQQQAVVRAEYTTDPALVEARAHREVIVSAVQLVANDQNEMALSLRDQGRVEEARDLLRKNAAWLDENSARYRAPALKQLGQSNVQDAQNLESKDWNKQRKTMRKRQIELDMQQMY